MKIYAESTSRFAVQLLTDMLVVSWVLFWVWAGTQVNDSLEALAEPGVRVSSSATSLAESMTEAGDFLGGLPLIGDGVAVPFDKASEASQDIARAGDKESAAAQTFAFWLGLFVAFMPILVVLPRYVVQRLRWVRDATAGALLLDAGQDLEVFALRAIAHQPLHVLARVSTDPVGALRRRDPAVVAALADLELDAAGLVRRRPAVALSGG